MDIVGILIILFLGAAIGRFLSGDGTVRALDAFGAGFLPYRADMGWPIGVQEGEPIPWNWSSFADRRIPPAEREPAPDAGIEIIELDGDVTAEVTGIDSGHVSSGWAVRSR